MADRTLARETERYDALARRIASAAPGNPAAAPSGLDEAEFEALERLAGSPRRILTAGPGAAHAGLLLGLAWPQAEIIAVDPEVSPQDSAEAARLINLHGRLRVETGAFASAKPSVRALGPEICAAEPDFDLIVLDGAADSASRLADLRLAASAVAPGGLVVIRGVMGRNAATVRAGVFDFLRFNWGFHYLGLPTDGVSGGLGVLRARGGWFAGLEPPRPLQSGEVGDTLRNGIVEQVLAMAGDAPLVEVAVGASLLEDMRRERDVLLKVSPLEAAAAYVDPIVDRIAAAVGGGVLFTGDLSDFASDEVLSRLFDRLADHNAAAIFAVTPPGEPGVAGPASRPAARLIDLAASHRLGAYAPAGLEFETLRHADANAAVSSRYLSLLMFAPPGGRRDAAGRLLVERTPASAAQHEQVELQRLIDQSALRADAARHLAERTRAESREQDVAGRLADKTRALDIANDAHDRARRAWDSDQRALREELRTQTDLTLQLKTTLDAAEATLLREHQLRQEFETQTLARLKALEQELAQTREAARIEAERLRWDMAAADAREQAARERLGQARDEIAAAQDELRTARGALKSLTDSDNRMRQRAEAAEGRIAAAQQLADGLKAEHTRALSLAQATAEREAARIRMSLADEVSRGQRLQTDAQAFAADVERLRAELRTLRDRHEAAASELASAQNLHAQAQASHAQGLVRLREDHAAELARVRQAALVVPRAEDASELKALRDAKSRLEQDIEARRAEAADLQRRLASTNQQAIDQACREVDLEASLVGVAAHLALSQEALETARRDPQGYRIAAQSYPQIVSAEGARTEAGRDLVDMAHTLHGRAADLSRDLGKTLEAVDARQREALEAIRASHAEAVASAGNGAPTGEAERTLARLSDVIAGNERMVRGIEATVLREDAPPLASDAGLEPEARLRDQFQRLEQVLHRLEAGPAPASEEAPDALAPDVLAAERFDAPDEAAVEPPSITAPTPAAPPSAVETADQQNERPFLILRSLKQGDEPASAEPASSEPPPSEPSLASPPRVMVDDLADPAPDAGGLDAAPARSVASRAWDWLRAYRETFNLVRLQKVVEAQLGRDGLRAKLFDADFYRSQGPIPADQLPLQHYLLVGEAQGRRPLRGFDPAFYRKQIGGAPVSGSLLRHFVEVGVDEGKSPSAELEPIARRALAAGQPRLEYFLRREDEARKRRLGTL